MNKPSHSELSAIASAIAARPTNKLVRSKPSPMALEQRFMFDGAAIDTAVDVSKPVVDSLLDFVAADTALPAAVITARAEAEKLVTDYLSQPDAKDKLFALFNGGQSTPSAQWQAAVDQLLVDLQTGGDAVRVELRTSAELQGALGAFAAQGPDGTPVIYLNKEWVINSNPPSDAISRILVEEVGHSIDFSLNGSADTAGDEGQVFAHVILGNALGIADDTHSDDHLQLTIDGIDIQAEAASSTFDAQGNALTFSSSTLKSTGNTSGVGATYLYSNVINIGGQQIDAVIELTELSNATLNSFDSTSNPYANNDYFQPNVNITTAGGYATFSIKFVLGGTYVNASNPGAAATLQHVYVNTYDLDGSSGSKSGRQFTDFQNVGSYTLNSGSLVNVESPSTGVTRFVTTIGGNIIVAPGQTDGDNIRARIQYDAVSSTTISMGDTGATGLAYYGIDFSQGVDFFSPVISDSTPPTIEVTTNKSSVKIGETATITFTLSEAATDFASGDVTVIGGTLSNFTGSGTTYTATFTPTATSGSVSVASSKFSDAAVNLNADGADANNSVALSYDGVAPTIIVSTDKSSLIVGETATITFTLSEAATDFASGDVTVSGGTLSNFTGGGTAYTATFTPTATNGSVSVASSRFSDAAGNLNADGADANNSVAITYNSTPSDTTPPTIAITSDKTSLKAGETATLTFTFSEDVGSSFAAGDITVSGGTLGTLTKVSATQYTAVFTPTAGSTTNGVVSVASGTFTDVAGNTNTDGADTNNAVTLTADSLPVATNDSATFTPGAATTVEVVTNDTTGDTVVATTVVFTSGSATDAGKTLVVAGEGTWSINATTGAITFTPLVGFTTNPTAVEYKVADAQGNFDTATVTLAKGAADLVTAKTLYSLDATPNVGDTVTFLITVTNKGGDAATNVQLTDQLPSGLTYTANVASQGSYDSTSGVWTIGTLAKDASVTLRLSATVNAAADGTGITNTTGKASSDQSDSTDVGNDLTETVTVDKPPVATNDSVTFTPGAATTVEVVTNDTTGDTVVATTVVFTSGSATDAGKTLVVAGEGTWSINATTGAITFTPLVGFTTNPTAVEYKVADAQGNFDTATVTLAKGAADLVTAKTVNNASPNVGDNVTFTLTVTNTGPDAATGVTVSDSLPAGLTYVSDSGNGAYSGGVWTVGSLANGATATLTIVVRADSTSNVVNSATAHGDQTDPNSGNDTSSASVDGLPVPSAPTPLAPEALPATPAPQVPPDSPIVPLPPFDSATLLPERSPLPLLQDRQDTFQDTLTSGAGFPVVVVEGTTPRLTVNSGITDQFVEPNALTRFALPFDAFVHTKSDAVISLQAKLADGSNLPAWVQFDAQSGTFQVNPPADFYGELKIIVIARDTEGREATAPFRFFVGQDKGKPQVQGRLSLSEQIKLAGKRPTALADLLRNADGKPVAGKLVVERTPAKVPAVREAATV